MIIGLLLFLFEIRIMTFLTTFNLKIIEYCDDFRWIRSTIQTFMINYETSQYKRQEYTAIQIITSILSKMTLIYCFSLAKVADILDFTHNAIFHIVVYHTTMYGIPGNIMVDTNKSASNMSKNGTD